MQDVTSAEARQEPVLQPNALDAIVEMIGLDDPEVIVDLLDTFLTDSQRQIEEMRQTFASGDFKTLHRAAHSMKSSSATFGALALSKLWTCAEQIDCVAAEHLLVVAALGTERAKYVR